MSQEVSKWLVNGLQPTYKWGILGYNPLTNLLLSSWDIQVVNSAFCCLAELLDEGIHNFHQIFASSSSNFPFPGLEWEQKKGTFLSVPPKKKQKKTSNGQKVTPLVVGIHNIGKYLTNRQLHSWELTYTPPKFNSLPLKNDGTGRRSFPIGEGNFSWANS